MTPFGQLKEGLAAAESLRRVEVALSTMDPPPSRLRHQSSALRAGVIVISVSAFELFLTGLVREQVARLEKRVPETKFELIPKAIQQLSMVETLRRSIVNSGEWATDRFPRMMDASRLIQTRRINSRVFGLTRESGAKAVRDVLRPLGLSDIFESADFRAKFCSRWGKSESATFIQDKLDEITVTRHRQAHAFNVNSALSIPRSSLEEGTRFLECFGFVLSDALRKGVSDILGLLKV